MPSPIVCVLIRSRVGGYGDVPEEPLPGPEDDREDHEPDLVHQPVLHQRLDQLALPATRRSPSRRSLRSDSSRTTSPRITVEFSQVASSSSMVVDTTYLGIPFMRSAKPTSSCMFGQAWAKPS